MTGLLISVSRQIFRTDKLIRIEKREEYRRTGEQEYRREEETWKLSTQSIILNTSANSNQNQISILDAGTGSGGNRTVLAALTLTFRSSNSFTISTFPPSAAPIRAVQPPCVNVVPDMRFKRYSIVQCGVLHGW
jgi:hypothetical protein